MGLRIVFASGVGYAYDCCGGSVNVEYMDMKDGYGMDGWAMKSGSVLNVRCVSDL